MRRAASTVLRANFLLPMVGPPDHIGEKSTFGEVLPPLPRPSSHVRLNGLPIGLLMPPLEDPEEALNRYFLAGPAGPKGQGTSSSLFNVLHVRCDEPPDYAEQLGESPRQQFHSSIPPSGIPSGLCLGWVCAALAASACRWEGLSDGGDIRRAFLASSGESWSKYTVLGTGW